MSRPPRGERLASKARPKRVVAGAHLFKYQLANNPNRAVENDLKRALQASLEEQLSIKQTKPPHQPTNKVNDLINGKHNTVIISSTNSSDVSRSINSSTSNESAGSYILKEASKRTRSGTLVANSPVNKRAKLNITNGHQNTTNNNTNITSNNHKNHVNHKDNCDGNSSAPVFEVIPLPHVTRAIRTYSRSQPYVLESTMKEYETDGQLNSSTPKPKSEIKTPNGKESRPNSSTPSASKSTQTPCVSTKSSLNNSSDKADSRSPTSAIQSKNNPSTSETNGLTPVNDQSLKLKRESKNYAYVKMTALKVSTSKFSSGSSKGSNSKKSSPNDVLNYKNTNKDSSSKIGNDSLNETGNCSRESISGTQKQNNEMSSSVARETNKNGEKSSKKSPSVSVSSKTSNQSRRDSTNCGISKSSNTSETISQVSKNSIPNQMVSTQPDVNDYHDDCLSDYTLSLSMNTNQNQANLKINKKRVPQGSWSLLGIPEEKVIYLRDDEPPRRLICYPAIKHVEGDVIQVRDSVLLRSGARKTDLPYIAKVCSFWEDAETGCVMMSLYWYYRPEHTEDGRKNHHLADEIFASRHRDVDSVECIEDKCYVLTFNEYCRYRKRCKMEQVNTTWSLTDVTIPLSNESYPRRNRIPDSDVNPELVFCCRQIYDSRTKRLLKNPMINSKYGHI